MDSQKEQAANRRTAAAGTHSWTIDVPERVGGYVELQADGPNIGDTLKMKVKVDGRFVDEENDKLEKPPASGYVFALQEHHDDYSRAVEQMGEAGPSESDSDSFSIKEE